MIEDEEEGEAAMDCSDKRKKQRRKWTVIRRWDANELLASEIEAEVLRMAIN